MVIRFETNDLDVSKINILGNVGHGLQLLSFGQNLPPPFCAPHFGCLMIFLFGFEANFYEQLFLEVWHSTLDLNAGNDYDLTSRSLQRRRASIVTWSRVQASCYVYFN